MGFLDEKPSLETSSGIPRGEVAMGRVTHGIVSGIALTKWWGADPTSWRTA